MRARLVLFLRDDAIGLNIERQIDAGTEEFSLTCGVVNVSKFFGSGNYVAEVRCPPSNLHHKNPSTPTHTALLGWLLVDRGYANPQNAAEEQSYEPG